MKSTEGPARGEIWLAALGAARPGEPGKTRPVLVLTPEQLLIGAQTELVSVVPLSSSAPETILNPQIERASGIESPSVAVVRAVRGLSRNRLVKCIGSASAKELFAVEQALLVALGLVRPS